jgi:hypothetical protein
MAEQETVEWCKVASGMTNDTPDSCVQVPINTTPICPNMTNAQFRSLMMQLRDIALRLISDRIIALSTMWTSEQKRMQLWLGRSDLESKKILQAGLSRLSTVMSELKPENLMRYDDDRQRLLTCTPGTEDGMTDASVCKPDSARRIIAFYSHICTEPDAKLAQACKVKALIHECTHFTDVFNSLDTMYGNGIGLQIWTRNHEAEAFTNADNLAHYIAHFEGVDLGKDIKR